MKISRRGEQTRVTDQTFERQFSDPACRFHKRACHQAHRFRRLDDPIPHISTVSRARSRFFPFQVGAEAVVFYAVSITDADIIISDGKSLEVNGVTPDKLMLPTGADLAARRDPVLAYAARLPAQSSTPKRLALFSVGRRK